MKLSELLEYTASQWLDDRTELVDGDSDSLWSDEFLVRQFNEAQRILARRAWCIIKEGELECGRIVLVTDKKVYDLHKSVLRVMLATPEDRESPLFRTSDAALRGAIRDPDLPFDIDTSSSSGRPLAIATDAGTRQARIFRTPGTDENGLVINLKIARLPLVWLTVDDEDAEPEVPEDYHDQLAKYAAGRALTLPNVDGAQKAEGRTLLSEFDAFVREARQDRQRAEMEPARWGFSSTTSLADR